MVSGLQYCTDLIALDLGHNGIDDLSWLEPLQNLQLLILSDNRMKDITPHPGSPLFSSSSLIISILLHSLHFMVIMPSLMVFTAYSEDTGLSMAIHPSCII